jgi:hypothetical protein
MEDLLKSILNEKMLIPILTFLIGLFVRKFLTPYLTKLRIKQQHFDLIEAIARKIAIYFMTNYPERDWRVYIGRAVEILIDSISISKNEKRARKIAERELTTQFISLETDPQFMATIKKAKK